MPTTLLDTPLGTRTRIVLLGDLHFFQMAVWPWQLGSKRFLGQTNLWLNRRRHFRLGLWPAYAEYIKTLDPDVLLGSGDYTTTALAGEFRMAKAALGPLLAAARTAVLVPGNHDRYTFASMRHRRFERSLAPWAPETWPHVSSVAAGLSLIALDPTRPNPLGASGTLGRDQLERLKTILQEGLPGQGPVLVLCHYPLGTPPDVPTEPPGHGLRDKAVLSELLGKTQRLVFYLHGHIHQPWVWRPPDFPNILTVNAGAPFLCGRRYPHGQGLVSLCWEDGDLLLERHWQKEPGNWEVERLADSIEIGRATEF